MTSATTIDASGLTIRTGPDAPVSVTAIDGGPTLGETVVPLVEVFTVDEQRARSSQAFVHSSLGGRLRYVSHERTSDADGETIRIVQRDPLTGLTVEVDLTTPTGVRAWRVQPLLRNDGGESIVVTAIVSAGVAFGSSESALNDVSLVSGASEWCAEGRWREDLVRPSALPYLDLDLHGQDGRGHFGRSSRGTWSTGESLPTGALVNADGASLGWQIETSAGWRWELSQTRGGGVLSLLGPTDDDHHFAQEIVPGEAFEAVPVVLAASPMGRDGVFAEMTRYRRWLTRESIDRSSLPVVYNDFMNTLMGQPSTEALVPLIESAAKAGAECFCIDAGWFADPAIGDWWDTVGEWREAPARFSSGLGKLIGLIHAHGMRSGLWLEPEVVGVRSPAAAALPENAFFHRFGRRVREHDRYHLDLRHPAARAHVDRAVDSLVERYGISYLKLDYNINPGPGTDVDAAGAGAGLLGHARALREWMASLRDRHPSVDIENCSSGAMRMDYSLLSVAQLQSTSDQQDYRLYPPIAAAAPASVLPEQCGNWAYPDRAMSIEETGFSLVAGVMGRLYLSGFLHDLRPEQWSVLSDAVAVHKRWRAFIAEAIPYWPLGLPGWDDDLVVMGLRREETSLLAVWSRGHRGRTVAIPIGVRRVETVFAADVSTWHVESAPLRLALPGGHTARIFRVEHS